MAQGDFIYEFTLYHLERQWYRELDILCELLWVQSWMSVNYKAYLRYLYNIKDKRLIGI